MSDEDIQRAMNEAKQFEAQDQMLKERIEFKNEAEILISSIEAALAQYGKQLDKDNKNQIKNELASFKKLTKKVNYETCSQGEFQSIKEARYRLESISSQLLYIAQNTNNQ